MRIDSHQHFWQYDPDDHRWITDDMQVIRKDFTPLDLHPLLQQHRFDGCVSVQVDQSEAETLRLLTLSDRHDFIKGVVGWVDLRSPALRDRLAYFRSFKKLKGFRHIVQGEPEGFLSDPKFVAGVRMLREFGFTYDLLVYHYQLKEALAFVYQLPDVSIVIDHLAKPSIRTREKTDWELNMAAMATFPNVYCKVSGMVTEANPKNLKQEEFNPYLDELMETFGPERLMYGSDWPVCLVAATYGDQLAIVENYFASLSASERERIMGENARTFYNL